MSKLDYIKYIIAASISLFAAIFHYSIIGMEVGTKFILLSSLILIIGFVISTTFFYKSLKIKKGIKNIILKILFSIINQFIFTFI